MNAFIDKNGVLVCLSQDAENGGATAIPVLDGTVMEAGKWKWDGSKWVAYVAPKQPYIPNIVFNRIWANTTYIKSFGCAAPLPVMSA